MQKRSVILLAAAAAICVALAAAALATGDRGVSRPGPAARAFPPLAAQLGEVASVGLRRSDLTIDFTRRGDDWLAVQKGDYPADAGKVRRLVLALADMTLVEPKTREAKLYPRLEVEEPGKGKSTLVTLKDKSGAVLAGLIVGKRSYDRLGAGNDGVYVRKPGDAQSWLARGSLDFEGDFASWLDRRIIDIPDQRIAKVTLTQPDGTILAISRAKPDGKFAAEGAPANAKYKSEAATGEPATALETLDLTDVEPSARMPVPDKGITTASLATFDGLTVDLKLFEAGKTDWITLAAAGTGKAAAEAKRIDDRTAGWSYAIPSYKARMLKTRLADLLAPAKGS